MKRSYCLLLSNLIFVSSYAQLEAAKGEHYLFPEFAEGVVLFKKGNTDVKMLNYNSLSEELVFDNRGKILAVPKEQLQRIDTVFIKERRFVVLDGKFVELLHHSAWDLYAQFRCNLEEKGKDAGFGGTSETSAINNPSAVRLGGLIYNMELPDGFKTKRYSIYWLKRHGDLRQFVNMKQLKKWYKDKNDLFNDYVKTHEVEYENQESIIQLIEYLESK